MSSSEMKKILNYTNQVHPIQTMIRMKELM